METVRPRILMLAALFAIFPLMLSFMPLMTALLEWHASLLAVSCAIVGLGISGLVLAFRRGSLLVLGLFWIALGGVALWIYPDVGPENDEIDTFLYASSCIYLVAGLGLTLAARQASSPGSSS